MQSLTSQFFAFVVTILIGLMISISFDIYNVTKTVVRPKRIYIYIGDILFWVITTINVIFFLLVGNWGEIRLYVLIGAALGAFLYFKLLRPFVVKGLLGIIHILRRIFNMLRRVVSYVVFAVSYPLALLAKGSRRFMVIPAQRGLAAIKRKVRGLWISLLKR